MSIQIVLPLKGTIARDELAGSIVLRILHHRKQGRTVDSWQVVPALPEWEMGLLRGEVADMLGG